MGDDMPGCVTATLVNVCKEALRLPFPRNRDVISYLLQQNGVRKLKNVRNKDRMVGCIEDETCRKI